MVWALALGRHAGRRTERSRERDQPAHRQRLHVHERRLGHDLQDRRAQPEPRQFVWVADPGVPHEGNTSRTRGIALWEDKVLANLPDGRVIAINRENGEIIWDKKLTAKNEFGNQERFLTAPIVADGKVLVQNGAGDGGTRGWVAALDVNTGNELWRWYTVPKPGEPGSETWKDDHNAWKTGRRRHLADRLLRSRTEPLHRRHRQSRSRFTTRSSGPATISTRTPSSRSTWPPARWRGTSSTRRTTRGTTTKPACSCSTTRRSADELRKVVGHYARNGFFYYGGPHQRTVHRRRASTSTT